MSISHPSFNKIFIYASILSLFIFISISSTSSGEDQNNSAINNGPIKHPVIDGGIDKPPQKERTNISEGSSLHLAKFDLTVAIIPDRRPRGNNVTLNFTFNNTDDGKTLTVQHINIDLLPIFNVTRIYSNEGYDGSSQNRIRIPKFVSEKNKPKSFKYDIYIPKNAALDIRNLIDHKKFNDTDIDEIITIKKCRADRTDIRLNDDRIFIQNNPPIIETANVSIIAHQVAPMEDEDTLLVSENLSNPLVAIFNISAGDVENGKKLTYGFILSKITDSGSKNETTANAISTCGDFSSKISIQPGERYSLCAVVNDGNNTTIKQASIIYRGDIYKKLMVPGDFLLKNSALVITIIISIFITILIFRRIGHCPQRVFTNQIVAACIIIIWFLFLLILNANPTKFPITGQYLIFNTIYMIEYPIYLTIFIIICQFIEKCFCLDDLINYHDNALWANYISSLGILIIFIFIIPEITNILSLSDYYVTMSTVMGTIFALVVTLSTQFPKNIYSSPTKKCFEYVFSWDEIPGNDKDNNKLKKFLTQDSEIEWEKNAKIEKIDNGNTIKVSTKEKYLLLKLNSENNEAFLEIYDISANKLDDIRNNKFKLIAMKQKDKLNIYGIYLDLDNIFLYPKVLQYFVKLYGVTLVISLLGLVTGTHIELNAKIVDPSLANLYNLFSIALFETTFLLIPPTVISLYHLMKVISFRGKITIKSEPSGAMVYLSKKHEKRSSLVYRLWMKTTKNAIEAISNRFFPRDKELACLIERPYCLNLCTPCTLMLMKGTYNLELHYEGLKTKKDTIQIKDAVEIERTIYLINLTEKASINS